MSRAEEKKQENLANVIAQGMARVLGGSMPGSSTGVMQHQQPVVTGSTPPFSMLRKLGRALMRKDSEASEPPVKAKEEKKRKMSESDSSETPEWIKAIKKKSSGKEKKKKDEDKKKKKKAKKLILPTTDQSDEEPEVTAEIKQSLIDGLKLADKLSLQELEGADWKDKFVQNADMKALKALAKANNVATTGVKVDIFDRIIEKLFE